jgi:ABC-2 type transport system permease protein
MQALLSGMIKSKSGRGKAVFTALTVGALALVLFTMFFGVFSLICGQYFDAGLGWLYFALFAMALFALCVVATIFTASALIFGAKDNELLLSMPIKPSAILGGRLLVILAMEYAFALIAALAVLLPWVTGGQATVSGIIYFAGGIVLLPLMATAVSMLLTWLLGLISSRLRYKNIVTLVLSVGFLGAYSYACFGLNQYMGDLVMRGEEIASAFHKAMPPFYLFGRGIVSGSLADFFQFTVWVIVPFTLTLLLISSNYAKLLTSQRSGAKITYKERKTKSGSAFGALIRKELALYWHYPTVVLNTSFASFIILAAGLALIVKGADMITLFLESIPFLSDINISVACAVVLTAIGSMNNLSASLVSLEGRNLWISKSIPVPAGTVFAAKIFTHWLVAALPCLFASICAGVVTAQTASDWLILLMLPQAFTMLAAVGGLVINLHFPRFDWTNETVVVKQSAAALVALFGSMGVVLALGLLYVFLLAGAMALMPFLWLCAAVCAMVIILLYTWLMKHGVKVYADL